MQEHHREPTTAQTAGKKNSWGTIIMKRACCAILDNFVIFNQDHRSSNKFTDSDDRS